MKAWTIESTLQRTQASDPWTRHLVLQENRELCEEALSKYKTTWAGRLPKPSSNKGAEQGVATVSLKKKFELDFSAHCGKTSATFRHLADNVLVHSFQFLKNFMTTPFGL